MKKTFLALVLVSSLVISCQKNNDNNSTPAPAPAPVPVPAQPHQYGFNNGTCFDFTTNTPVDPSLCNNLPNNGYNNNNGGFYGGGYYGNGYYGNTNVRWLNGNCVNAAGQTISQLYCYNLTYSGQCNGIYVRYSAGYFEYFRCWGTLCKGQTLMEYSSGKQITCQ